MDEEKVRLLRDLALVKGDARGQLEYGVWLLNEKGDAEALSLFHKCIEETKGEESMRKIYGSACYALGFAYEVGRGVEQDSCEGLRWLRLAMEAGNGQAKALLRRRRIEFWRRRKLDFILLMCLVVFIAVSKTVFELSYVLYHHEEFKKEISGADELTPSYEWRDHLLGDRETRKKLIQKANALIDLTTPHSEINDLKKKEQPLSESFQHTRGVVAHFTRPALDDPHAFESPELNWIKSEYIDKVINDHCNAFVFNVLIIPPGRYENRSRGVDFHVDQTLIQSTTQREQSAFTVSVGYLRIPKNMDGGELHLNNRLHRPREGSVLVFRGDQTHAVNAFCIFQDADQRQHAKHTFCPLDASNASLTRVSFVFEQYHLPPYKLRRSPYFIIAPTSLEESFIPIISAFPLGPSLIDAWLHIRKRFFFSYKRKYNKNNEMDQHPSQLPTQQPQKTPPNYPSPTSRIHPPAPGLEAKPPPIIRRPSSSSSDDDAADEKYAAAEL